MMYQNIKFNFLLNLEDYGKIILKLRGCWRSNKGQNVIFPLKISNFDQEILMKYLCFVIILFPNQVTTMIDG